MNEFGNKIKQLRGSQSLRTASKNIGISHTYLDSLEKGFDPRSGKERKPTEEVIEKIAKYYDYPFLRLMRLAGFFVSLNNLSDEDLEKEVSNEIQELALEFSNHTNQKERNIEYKINKYTNKALSVREIHYFNNVLNFLEQNKNDDILFISILLEKLNEVKHSNDKKEYEDIMHDFGEFLKSYLNFE
ncbi:helix-turn-helix domain-containing protein [Staphylococcus xylosus]